MPKVQIYCDSMYPFFGIIEAKMTSRNADVEVSAKFLAEYRRVEKAFEAMQEELKKLGECR